MNIKFSYIPPRCEAYGLAPEGGCMQNTSPYGGAPGHPGGDSPYSDYNNWF